jgi:hypothetical protein
MGYSSLYSWWGMARSHTASKAVAHWAAITTGSQCRQGESGHELITIHRTARDDVRAKIYSTI